MENKEFQFKGATLGGFPMLFANILLTLSSIALIVMGILQESNEPVVQKYLSSHLLMCQWHV